MKRISWLLVAVCVWILALGPATAIRAQTAAPVVAYQAGWNMVGGPAGTDFSAAGGLFAWNGSAYIDVSNRQAVNCQGYWAYFFSPRSVTLPQQSATSVTCPLQAGWNLVGNPFDGVAYLPLGSTAYAWNGAGGAYAQVSSLPPGTAAWVYASAAGTATLVTPTTPPAPIPPPTLLISSSSPGSTFGIHVGDTIELVTPLSSPYDATWDSHYLQLIQEGDRGDLTCVGDPACEFNFTTRFWFWRAVQAGTTSITLDPACLRSTPPCEVPSRQFQIVISP